MAEDRPRSHEVSEAATADLARAGERYSEAKGAFVRRVVEA